MKVIVYVCEKGTGHACNQNMFVKAFPRILVEAHDWEPITGRRMSYQKQRQVEATSRPGAMWWNNFKQETVWV